MKRIMLFLTFLLFGAHLSFAQPPERGLEGRIINHEENMEKILERLDEQVSLSDDQQLSIKNILEETTAKIREIEVLTEPQRQEIKLKIEEIRSSGLTRIEKRDRIKQIRDRYAPQIREFREKIDSIREESKERINEVLTVEQKAKLYEFFTEKRRRKGEKFKEKMKKKQK